MAVTDPRSYITSLYQTQLNRAPDAAGLDYWAGQMATGMTPNQVRANISSTREGGINQIYGDVLDRAPDPAGYAHYNELYPQIGYTGMRADIQRQPEYQNKLLDDPAFYRQQARQATAGINAMPGVFSDYTLPSMATTGPQALSQGQGGLPQLQSLLSFGLAQSQPTVPSLSSLLDAAIPEAVKKPAAEKAADKAKPALESLLKDGGVRRSA